MSALLQIRQDARISRVEGGLEVRGVTVWDTGAYTCELEADMETHVTRTHHLQVLGGSKSVIFTVISLKVIFSFISKCLM